MKTALVLSGGGARGLAHIGVLKTLEKHGVNVDLIIGCSFGAIIGALYAQTPDAGYVEEKLHEFTTTKVFGELGVNALKKHVHKSDDLVTQFTRSVKNWLMLGLSAKRAALLKGERLRNAVDWLIKDEDISLATIPFACNATDLITGKPYLFTSGSICEAVTASATIPGFFPPVEIEGQKLVDGAITHNLPVRFVRNLGADFTIAVDVHPDLHPETEFNNVLDVILRTKTITAHTLSEETRYNVDLIINPPIKSFYWHEFDRIEEIVRAGEIAAEARLDKLEKLYRSYELV
ncbi:MAG: patatin-like phospholipase family protein [Calditrichota bacterium]